MESVDDMPVIPVDSDGQLAELANSWQELPSLALDTEFMRTNTFYPKLGLLQISDGKTCYLIDPLKISDWQPLVDLFQCEALTFILHSSGEDLVLLFTSLGSVPINLFDTQIAAAFLGYGFSLSYQALVKDELDKDIEKDETRSDWLRRPLSDSQLRYAALDVRYLHELMTRLNAELSESGKSDWFLAECQQQVQTAKDTESPAAWREMYKGISNAWRLSIHGLTLLQRLAYWREQQARRKDRPRNWIAKDAELFTIASEMADSGSLELSRLQQLKGIAPGLLNRQGERLIRAMQKPIDGLPEKLDARLDPPLPIGMRNLIKELQAITRNMAEELHMAPELIARKRQILALLDTYPSDGKLTWSGDMAGWRKELLQENFERAAKGNR